MTRASDSQHTNRQLEKGNTMRNVIETTPVENMMNSISELLDSTDRVIEEGIEKDLEVNGLIHARNDVFEAFGSFMQDQLMQLTIAYNDLKQQAK